ncbi:MAG: MBL fold metallo-hydrolase [Candidatus Eisenbacteria bacterium]|nr:MBL fold metallo-hydrolase [Candidatus Eisenbacteria bacterium]
MDQPATRAILLGSGTPHADPDRCGPAVAIVAGGELYLFDCGPGIVRRAAAACRAGATELEAVRLQRLFLTHLHSDHTAGLPDLLLTPWVLGRRAPLEVWGPPGTAAMLSHIQEAYRADIRLRLEGREPANETGWQARPHEIATGRVYEDAQVAIDAFPVRHGPAPAFGYRIAGRERSIVISGDTAPTDEIVSQSLGCDLLFHEVYSRAGFARQPADWQAYHREMHTASDELADLASRACPGLLVLYHQLFWGESEEGLIAELRGGYGARIASGRDLDVY